MITYLEGFEQRMKLTACIASVINRRNRNTKIEEMFGDYELDNIIFSVLIHIMERTLTEENDCDLNDIAMFLFRILCLYGKTADEFFAKELARYIVKDILQNKGEGYSYNVMDYAEGCMKQQNIRLIKDNINENNEIVYILSQQGYDLLLKTKEIDDFLGPKIEEIRLGMLIKKKNYSAAVEQSVKLLQMLNEQQNEIILFERDMRRDVGNVSGEQYDTMKRNIYSMLTDEYETMQDIEKTLDLAKKNFEEEVKMGKIIEDVDKARESVTKISRNVSFIINKQRHLLSEIHKLGSLYSETLKHTISMHKIRCYDIETNILNSLETYSKDNILSIDEICAGLLAPLALPELPKTLGIGLFYEPQNKREDDDISDEEDNEELVPYDEAKIKAERKNKTHIDVIRTLLKTLSENETVTFSEFWSECKKNFDIAHLTEDKLIFLVAMKLYDIGEVSIDEWRKETDIPNNPSSEFDLSYVLARLFDEDRRLYGIKRFFIEKGTVKAVIKWTESQNDQISYGREVIMDELIFKAEVYKNEGNSEDT